MTRTDTNTQRTLLLIIGITAASFIVWVGGLFVIWFMLRLVGISTSFWAMTEALSTAVAAAAVLGAGYVAYRELDEIANSRHMEVADRLFEELNSPENVDARRWVFQNLPDDPQAGIPSLSSDGRHQVKKVLNSLDRVAFLTQSGWIPDDLIMPWMNPMIVKAWAKLEPYVDHEAERRNEPDYYLHARQLADRCRAWRKTHLPSAELTWLDDAL
jgi:hypothetical protein